jgi:hypothetical protein
VKIRVPSFVIDFFCLLRILMAEALRTRIQRTPNDLH